MVAANAILLSKARWIYFWAESRAVLFTWAKRPGRTENPAIDDQLRVRELKKRLNDAVKLENYEEAARLRDEILTLEKGANSSK